MTKETTSIQLTSQYLKTYASPEGWWPYLKGQEPANEATVWCAIACRQDLEQARKSLQYLTSVQNADGGWATQGGIKRSDWTTGQVLIGMQVLQKAIAEAKNPADKPLLTKAAHTIDDGVVYLLRSRSDFLTESARVAMFMAKGSDFDYPRGWPWTQNTFNWVEPSAYAVLAMRMSPRASEKRYALALGEAADYFLNKQCESGGWNYGVRQSMGAKLPSQPVPTAWALLAMHGSSSPNLKAGLDYLQDDEDVQLQTAHAQALTTIALSTYGIDVKERAKRLEQHYLEHQPIAHNLLIVGLSTLAMQIPTTGNPLAIPGAVVEAKTEETSTEATDKKE